MKLAQNFLCALVKPYTYRELPGWGYLYRNLVGSYERDAFWVNAEPRNIRGKLHGYELTLDLQRWSERATYFLGRFYDLPTQLLMKQYLRPGDRFCDIGANIGMLTVLGARLVGEQGIVDAFEPNPMCVTRLRNLLRHNGIQNVRVHQLALGEIPGTLTLSVKSTNSGEGTLGAVTGADGFDSEIAVTVTTGDTILAQALPPPILLKLDVEGFECQALAGLSATLSHHVPMVCTEVLSDHLSRAGRTVQELFGMMQDYGYSSYLLSLRRSGLRHKLYLPRCKTHDPLENVLWVPDRGPAAVRARQTLPLTG